MKWILVVGMFWGLTMNGKLVHPFLTTTMKKRPQEVTAILDRKEGDNTEGSLLQDVLSPRDDCQVDRMSGTDLAYMGDVVYELFIRSRMVWPSKRTSDLQKEVVALVRAEHQSLLLERLKESFPLTEKEQQVLSRGRNSSRGNRRNPAAYQDSTAFEALIGYLYITDRKRCSELLSWVDSVVDEL